MEIVTLRKNEDRRINNGHCWAFSNEIRDVSGSPQPGDLVRLHNHAARFLGIGLYNPNSLIAVRVLTRIEEEIDFQFFRRRIESALALRKQIYPSSDAYRLIHGESDFLPGLIVDVYGDYLAVQTLSAGMDRRLTLIADVLESILHPKGIVERNEPSIRTLEGLPLKKGILRGTLDHVVVDEESVRYNVDMLEGQKTGLFLDQRENRTALRRYVRGARVLDCFCNDGGFALHAARAGATNVSAVDVSDSAIARARENAGLNGLQDRIDFVTGDAFDYLARAVEQGEKFDLIILDPPSFAKSKKSIATARKGYREIHSSAFRLLNNGGILLTASCSHHMYEETFLSLIAESARSEGKSLSLLEWRGAGPDHPVLPEMPETRYLKCGIFRVQQVL